MSAIVGKDSGKLSSEKLIMWNRVIITKHTRWPRPPTDHHCREHCPWTVGRWLKTSPINVSIMYFINSHVTTAPKYFVYQVPRMNQSGNLLHAGGTSFENPSTCNYNSMLCMCCRCLADTFSGNFISNKQTAVYNTNLDVETEQMRSVYTLSTPPPPPPSHPLSSCYLGGD